METYDQIFGVAGIVNAKNSLLAGGYLYGHSDIPEERAVEEHKEGSGERGIFEFGAAWDGNDVARMPAGLVEQRPGFGDD